MKVTIAAAFAVALAGCADMKQPSTNTASANSPDCKYAAASTGSHIVDRDDCSGKGNMVKMTSGALEHSLRESNPGSLRGN